MARGKKSEPECRFGCLPFDCFVEAEIMKTILQSCIRLCCPERSLFGKASKPARRAYRFGEAALAGARYGVRVSDERRRQMILDTERYLSNPRSKAWRRTAEVA
jgi:hypothetical protein